MRKIPLIIALLFLVSCSEKTANTYPDSDFADRIVNFAIASYDGQYIELPELYPETARFLPDPKEDQLVLAEKVKVRGFKMTSLSVSNLPLEGRRTVTLTFEKGACQCEVAKIYNSTRNVMEYRRSERIKCSKK